MEEKKKAFLTGAIDEKKYLLMKKKIEYLGYEFVGCCGFDLEYYTSFLEVKIARLRLLLSCDVLFVCNNRPSGIYKNVIADEAAVCMEKSVANYLAIPVYTEERLDWMVASKAVSDPEQEVGNDQE